MSDFKDCWLGEPISVGTLMKIIHEYNSHVDLDPAIPGNNATCKSQENSMSTATTATTGAVAAHEAAMAQHEQQAAVPVVAPLAPLWPRGIRIPFIGVTGEFGVGKTLFGLLIDPPRCVHYDFEKSAETYESGLGFTRVDMQDLARAKLQNNRFRPIDLFKLWRDHFQSLPKGRYRVAVIDDATSLEDGLTDYVRANPAEFGYTANQFAKSESMLWGAVKSAYKNLMLSAGIETCVFVTHMRNQFAGNRPTGKREPKGKETVMELASLYLCLDRRPDDKGRVPAKPNANKIKDRLSTFILNEETGEMEGRPILPPRIVECTPAKIRHYINNPPNYERLKKEELLLPEHLSEDEKLLLQSQIAADQKEMELAKAANIAAVQQARAAQAQAAATAPQAAAVDQSAAVHAAQATKTVAAAMVHAAERIGSGSAEAIINRAEAAREAPPVVAETPAPAPPPVAAALPDIESTEDVAVEMVTKEQLDALKSFKVEKLQIPTDQWKAALAKRVGLDGKPITSALQLTKSQAEEMLANLEKKWREKSLHNGLHQGLDAATAAIQAGPAGGADAMSRWANGQPPLAAQEQPPF